MKKFQCDICKKEVSESNLVTLSKLYQTEWAADVCKGCSDKITDINVSIELIMDRGRIKWVKNFMEKMRK